MSSVAAAPSGAACGAPPSPPQAPAGAPAPPARDYHKSDFPWEDLAPAGRAFEERVARLPLDAAAATAAAAGSQAAWNAFYERNRALFFKPRHFVPRAFPGVLERAAAILEVGVGNGSNLTLLEAAPGARLFLCDVAEASLEAVAGLPLVGAHPGRVRLFAWDVVTGGVPAGWGCPPAAVAEGGGGRGADARRRASGRAAASVARPPSPGVDESAAAAAAARADRLRQWADPPPQLRGGMDAALLMFVLSSLPPADHAAALAHVWAALKPGGTLCFRDYGLYDAAQLRAEDRHVLAPRLHLRGDGTLAYFFTVEEVAAALERAGFRPVEVEYHTVRAVNRKKGLTLDRVWVHARAVKPG